LALSPEDEQFFGKRQAEVVWQNNVIADFDLGDLEPVQLMPITKALETIESCQGHHCRTDHQYQFNIKMYHHYDAPKEVKELLSDDEIYQLQNDGMEQNLRFFMGEDCDMALDYMFPWVNSNNYGRNKEMGWWTAGRMSGWLIIQSMDGDPVDEYNNVKDDYETYVGGNDYEETLAELKDALDKAEMAVRVRAEELVFISKLINQSKKGLAEYLCTVDAYGSVYEDKKAEKEREEWVRNNTIYAVSGEVDFNGALHELKGTIDSVVANGSKKFTINIDVIVEKDEQHLNTMSIGGML